MSAEVDLRALFLGAHGAQDALFERLLSDHLREHLAWRRAFHPDDAPPAGSGGVAELEARTRAELQRLTVALRRSVPVSSPRYLGHMVSDLLTPALLAQMVTTLYNPNNVTSEVAPVTVGMERAAAAQLATMVGFDTAPNATRSAWGHLTGGGTVANIESLWMARAVRCWPVAVSRAVRRMGYSELEARVPPDDRAALGLAVADIHALHAQIVAWLDSLAPAARESARQAIERERIEWVGATAYPRMHVLVPTTAHYSWEKTVRLLGIGADQLDAIPVTERMRLDAMALEQALELLHERGEVVLAVVPVLGTTEYGSIDPVHDVIALRERCGGRGQAFWVHCDAAWGGYLATVFRDEDGALRPHEAVRRDFRFFPSTAVYSAFAALGQCDSVTVDPHKLGYVPFGAGAFLLGDRRNRHFVAQNAPYVFGQEQDDELGRYALEGSRPGAMAAAVCVAHRVLPLHAAAFGRLPANSIRASEHFFEALERIAKAIEGVARVAAPFEPDSNLVCVAVNPADNTSLHGMNAFTERLYGFLSVEPEAPRQDREFYVSRTRTKLADLTPVSRDRLMELFGLTVIDDDHIFLLRHTLMNPWLSFEHEGNYLDRYCEHLAGLIRKCGAE